MEAKKIQAARRARRRDVKVAQLPAAKSGRADTREA